MSNTRTAITTGANSGIGLATVLELARRGFRSVGTVRSEAKAAVVAAAAREANVAITIAELRVGALLANRRRKAARSAYVEAVIATVPVLDYDVEVAEAHASCSSKSAPRASLAGLTTSSSPRPQERWIVRS
jgi:NAD(P)-dependent dehydrogenase (short-subunit alcohol dehydrogenase family)